MSWKVTQKLWPHLRDPAGHLMAFKPSGLSQKSSIPRTDVSYTPRRALSWSRTRSQSHTTPKKTVSKSFVSCGILFLDINPTTHVTSSTLASCTTSADNSLYAVTTIPRRSITSLAQQAWRREIHSSSRRRERGNARRNKSSVSAEQNNKNRPQNGTISPKAVPPKIPDGPTPESTPSNYLHLPHMPKMPHRPTKEELLAAATGFWSRLKVRFKWFSIRSARPWNIDDWSAFVSWFVLGNIVWVLVGTTTFFSLVIFSINTVVAQGM